MIASDVLLTTTMLVLGAFMAVEGRDDLLPVLLVLAAGAAFATVAVARSVSKHDRQAPEGAGRDRSRRSTTRRTPCGARGTRWTG